MNPLDKYKTCKHKDLEFIEEDEGGRWFRCKDCSSTFNDVKEKQGGAE